MLRRLDTLLNIEVGERRLVGLLYIQYFCMGIASTFTQTTAFALFLTAFSSSSLPFTYVVMAITLNLLTALYLQAGRRLSFAGTLTLNLGTLLLITAMFSVSLAVAHTNWLIFVLPVLFQIVVSFGNMAFWSLAGRIFNVRQGKRLFGVVGAGEWSAIVIMGFLMPTVISLVGVSNLLWLAAAGMVGALLTMLTTMRLYSHLLQAEPPPVTNSRPDAVPGTTGWVLLRNRYVQLIFGLTLIWWVGFFFLDNIFYLRAAQQFPSGDKLAGFLGLYLGALGVVTLFSNFFAVGRIIGAAGLRGTLFILPAGLTLGALAMVLGETLGGPAALLFWIAVATKVWDLSVGFSVDQAARGILYQPLPALLRTRVQTLADGAIQPLATGLAGLGLIAVNFLFPGEAMPLSIGLALLAGALLLIAIAVGRQYGTALLQALAGRRLNGTELVVGDRAAMSALRQGLKSPNAGSVIYSLRILGEIEPKALVNYLPVLLDHREADVRWSALNFVASERLQSFAPVIATKLGDEPSSIVRGAALRTLGILGDVGHVLPYAGAEDASTQTGAIVGLLTNRSPEGVVAGGRKLVELFRSVKANERARAAVILGEWRDPSVVSPLQHLIADPDAAVRRSALQAAGNTGSVGLLPQLVAALAAPSSRSAAVSGLVGLGARAVPKLGEALSVGFGDRTVVLQVVKVLGRIGGKEATDLLLKQVDTTDSELRSATLYALHRCRFHAGPADARRAQGWIGDEIALAANLSAAEVDVGLGDETSLLRAALSEQVRRARDRVLILLSLTGDAAAVARAHDNLLHGSPDKIAYALETIDIHTPRALRASVLPLLDNLPADQRLQKLKAKHERLGRDERLVELSANAGHSVNGWTQACALHAAGSLAIQHLPALIESHRLSNDPLIRTTVASFEKLFARSDGAPAMLSTIEKVIILRSAAIFAETSDEILADVAAISTEVEAFAGETMFEKGAAGDSMYVVAAGVVRVHDGERRLDTLRTGEVFGEMALLDPEPRSASVSVVDDALLLRVDQQALYELIDERPEVARGLLKVLSTRLRSRMQDLSDLRDRLGSAG